MVDAPDAQCFVVMRSYTSGGVDVVCCGTEAIIDVDAVRPRRRGCGRRAERNEE